jgi:proteasome lid subunit RPN8/RPN11
VQAFPREACGLLGGRWEGAHVRLFIVPVPNRARSGLVFRMTSQGLATARRTLQRRALLLCGCFHTHPTLGPEPSSLDRYSMSRFPLWWLIHAPMRRGLRMVRAGDSGMERAPVRVG